MVSPMKIDKDTTVTLRFTITESNGTVLENGKTPISYLHGGYDNLLPKIEAALHRSTDFDARREVFFGNRA